MKKFIKTKATKIVASLTCIMFCFSYFGTITVAEASLAKYNLNASKKLILSNDAKYFPQGMCVAGDDMYIASLYDANKDKYKEATIKLIKNVSTSHNVLTSTNTLKVGHANGMTYHKGYLYIAGCEDNIIYKVQPIVKGNNFSTKITKKYSFKTNSTYNVNKDCKAKNIAYFKTEKNRDYYIVGIGETKNHKSQKYLIGYFDDKKAQFVATKYFDLKRPGNDYTLNYDVVKKKNGNNGNQGIQIIKTNNKYKLITTITASVDIYDNNKKIINNNFTKNVVYVTDITSLMSKSNKCVLSPETRLNLASSAFEKYEAEQVAFVNVKNKSNKATNEFVPYSSVYVKNKNGKKEANIYTYSNYKIK